MIEATTDVEYERSLRILQSLSDDSVTFRVGVGRT